MPLFSRFKSKGVQPTLKKGDLENGTPAVQRPARWQSRWESTTIEPDEVVDLVHACTAEMKKRGMHAPGPATWHAETANQPPYSGGIGGAIHAPTVPPEH